MQRPLTHSLVRHSSRHKNSRARQKFLGRYVRTGPICEHLGLTSLSPRPARRRDRFLGKAVVALTKPWPGSNQPPLTDAVVPGRLTVP
jgi:hypothetical protein